MKQNSLIISNMYCILSYLTYQSAGGLGDEAHDDHHEEGQVEAALRGEGVFVEQVISTVII